MRVIGRIVALLGIGALFLAALGTNSWGLSVITVFGIVALLWRSSAGGSSSYGKSYNTGNDFTSCDSSSTTTSCESSGSSSD